MKHSFHFYATEKKHSILMKKHFNKCFLIAIVTILLDMNVEMWLLYKTGRHEAEKGLICNSDYPFRYKCRDVAILQN